MNKVFGFNEDELKLLLVSVRHMRRTFEGALKNDTDPSLQAYARLYDALYDKLLDMAGPLPEGVADLL